MLNDPIIQRTGPLSVLIQLSLDGDPHRGGLVVGQHHQFGDEPGQFGVVGEVGSRFLGMLAQIGQQTARGDMLLMTVENGRVVGVRYVDSAGAVGELRAE